MASVKTDRPVGPQVQAQVKQVPAETINGGLQVPASKPAPKKLERKQMEPKKNATKGRKPAAKRRSLEDECINKQHPVTKEVVTKGVKATRQSQKRSIDDSITGECISKQQAVTKDAAIKGSKTAPKTRKKSVIDESTSGETL